MTAGEVAKVADTDPVFTINRLYRTVDLEVFYFNDRNTPGNNCDRTGPVIGAGPYVGKHHQLNGSNLEFAVPATDTAGVWRVLIVATDNTVDGQGRGMWKPVELTDDGTGTYRGSTPAIVGTQMSYAIQAVDRRGNVTWLDFQTAQLPSSRVALAIPEVVDVTVPGTPPTALVTGSAQICPGATSVIQAVLTGRSPWNLTWSDGVVQSGITVSPATRVVSPGSTTSYSVTSLTDQLQTGTATGQAVITVSDLTGPVVAAPLPIAINQSVCGPNGATGATSSALAAYLAAGSATDDCTASPVRLAPQVNEVNVTNATVFPAGTTTVTFRYQDGSGNLGTATSTVVVRLWGDLNLSTSVTSTDVFILSNYLVGNVTQGTPPFTAPLGLGDVNHSGAVSSTDLFILKNHLAGNVACLAQ